MAIIIKCDNNNATVDSVCPADASIQFYTADNRPFGRYVSGLTVPEEVLDYGRLVRAYWSAPGQVRRENDVATEPKLDSPRRPLHVFELEIHGQALHNRWEQTESSRRPGGRLRRPGGGRKAVTQSQPTLLADLERLVNPLTRGDPERPLRWTCKSVRRLAAELRGQGHAVGPSKTAELLHRLGYSLQSHRKRNEGKRHPDRDGQFGHINAQVVAFQAAGEPVISVDTKKKELVGSYRNPGRQWQPKGAPEAVRVHDFVDPRVGRAIPYGVYDLGGNEGWVSVGEDPDTAEFAVETIRRWWRTMGRPQYPRARRLLITADGGGSNGSRSRLWKWSL